MFSTGSREITIKKNKLIEKIKENKKNHIVLYEKAVIAYKEEALEQLDFLTGEVQNGELGIALDLVTPVNNEENYDSIIEMFEWEVNDEVVLTQNEFKEYVQDEIQFATHALMSNMSYSDKF